MGVPGNELQSAIQKFTVRGPLNTRAGTRISSSIRYLQQVNVTFWLKKASEIPETKSFVQNLYTAMTHESKHFFAYTDGSTNPKVSSCNSGCGAVISDSDHNVIWSGGLIVRADGNNFIPEVAAAACVIQALPQNKSLTLRSDSLATIGSLKNILVSERKRIRAPGRAWLNFCRANLLGKRSQITFEHVFSHSGTQSIAQKGNDLADKIANDFRVRGDCKSASPVPYFSLTEEDVVLQYGEKVIQNDPRRFLKSLEKERMIEFWKKAPKQFEWFALHPNQVMNQAKRIWEKSIRLGDGGLWLYYIFAVCQWLPTNHRSLYNVQIIPNLELCKLCVTGEVEDMKHTLLVLPFLPQGSNSKNHSSENSSSGDYRLQNLPYNSSKNCANGGELKPGKNSAECLTSLNVGWRPLRVIFGRPTLRNPRFQVSLL